MYQKQSIVSFTLPLTRIKLEINNIIIDRHPAIKFSIIDENLNWKTHINYLHKKKNSRNLLYKSRLLNEKCLKQLYNLGHMLVDICEIWQKVFVFELAKSAYFRSASSVSDNK